MEASMSDIRIRIATKPLVLEEQLLCYARLSALSLFN